MDIISSFEKTSSTLLERIIVVYSTPDLLAAIFLLLKRECVVSYDDTMLVNMQSMYILITFTILPFPYNFVSMVPVYRSCRKIHIG